MTLLYSNPCFLDHKTGAHPEKPARLEAVTARLQASGLDEQCRRPASPPAPVERICRVHMAEYVEVSEALLAEERLLLRCEGLDTLATVYVNGCQVGCADNMHLTWEWDI